MKWINFLHLYQPPTQTAEILDVVVRESYTKIINLLERHPDLKLTLNISGSLLELLESNERHDVINGFVKIAEKGQIELVASAMYHPILPLVNETEIRQQINLHNKISQRLFGTAYHPTGFYLPEMAYTEEVGKLIKSMGYQWIILDEIHAKGVAVNPQLKYKIKDVGLNVVFRDRKISKTFPPEFILNNPEYLNKGYVITAHDGELYGHWHKDDRGYYNLIFTNPKIQTMTISDYIAQLEPEQEVEVITANWESTQDELERHIPFALWKHPDNIFHNKLWTLADYVVTAIEKNAHDSNIQKSMERMHKGLASCAWWWASGRTFGPFSPESWNPSEIEKGAQELLAAIRTLKNASLETYLTTEKIFGDLRDTVWKHHWEKTKVK